MSRGHQQCAVRAASSSSLRSRPVRTTILASEGGGRLSPAPSFQPPRHYPESLRVLARTGCGQHGVVTCSCRVPRKVRTASRSNENGPRLGEAGPQQLRGKYRTPYLRARESFSNGAGRHSRRSWDATAPGIGSGRARRFYVGTANPGITSCWAFAVGCLGPAFSSSGLLIHAARGTRGGTGAPRTKRSGCAA